MKHKNRSKLLGINQVVDDMIIATNKKRDANLEVEMIFRDEIISRHVCPVVKIFWFAQIPCYKNGCIIIILPPLRL